VSVDAPIDPPAEPVGRMARLRARAERTGDRYQRLAQTRPLLGLPLAFVARYTARQGMLLASAVAFRMFLWLMPLALLTAGILSAFAAGDSSNITSAARSAGITGAASQEVVTSLQSGHRSWWTAVLIGAVLFLWTTRTLIRNLILVNAHAWQATVPKSQQRDVFRTTLLFAVGWIAMLALAGLIARIDHLLPGGFVLAVGLQGAAVAGVWLGICLRLPDRRETWVDLIPGCLLLGFGLAILHLVSRVYLPRRIQHSSQLYGSLGVAAVILAWLLIIGQVIVSAAFVNSVWAEYRARRRAPRQYG
jgi:membrane protein